MMKIIKLSKFNEHTFLYPQDEFLNSLKEQYCKYFHDGKVFFKDNKWGIWKDEGYRDFVDYVLVRYMTPEDIKYHESMNFLIEFHDKELSKATEKLKKIAEIAEEIYNNKKDIAKLNLSNENKRFK